MKIQDNIYFKGLTIWRNYYTILPQVIITITITGGVGSGTF